MHEEGSVLWEAKGSKMTIHNKSIAISKRREDKYIKPRLNLKQKQRIDAFVISSIVLKNKKRLENITIRIRVFFLYSLV